MDKPNRRDELFTNAMSNMIKDKLGMSIDLLNEILQADPDDRVSLLARGSVYMKMKNAKNAIADFNQALVIDPRQPKPYHLRGLAREMEGDNDGALDDFNKAIEIDPEYGAAYYSRATLLTKLGREDAASKDMKMVAHLTNRNIESLASEKNVWRTRQMQLEAILESELNR